MPINFEELLPPKPEGWKRYSHEGKGKVLKSTISDLVYVPFEQVRGGWNAVTLHDPKGVYPPSGYNIVVADNDVETAEEIEVKF